MINIANITLATPFVVPKAMPILRCFVGVTRRCCIISSAMNIAIPIHLYMFSGS